MIKNLDVKHDINTRVHAIENTPDKIKNLDNVLKYSSDREAGLTPNEECVKAFEGFRERHIGYTKDPNWKGAQKDFNDDSIVNDIAKSDLIRNKIQYGYELSVVEKSKEQGFTPESSENIPQEKYLDFLSKVDSEYWESHPEEYKTYNAEPDDNLDSYSEDTLKKMHDANVLAIKGLAAKLGIPEKNAFRDLNTGPESTDSVKQADNSSKVEEKSLSSPTEFVRDQMDNEMPSILEDVD